MRLGLSFGQKLADHFAAGGFAFFIMLGHDGERLGAAKLPRDFAPRSFAQRRAVFAAATADGIELRADEHGGFGLRHTGDASLGEQGGYTGPFVRRRSEPGQMVKQRQRVGLAAAELRREIEDGVRFRFLAGQSADDFGRETGEILGEIRPLEKAFRLLIIRRRFAFANLIQMHGEFRRIKRLAVAQIFARRDNFIPRFERHNLKSESLLPRQHTVNPALFFSVRRIKRGECLGKTPEALVAACAVFDEESFQRFAATGGEKNHALVDAVEDGFAVTFDFCFAESRSAFVGLFEHFEQVELRHFLFSGRA
jgi:hypothetical protein